MNDFSPLRFIVKTLTLAVTHFEAACRADGEKFDRHIPVCDVDGIHDVVYALHVRQTAVHESENGAFSSREPFQSVKMLHVAYVKR